ncbi:MAG: hydrogenase maturation protease [Rhodospirillales bacterium]|nr:hydrogenase maturation protease [Rhodospirillales bacterium]
MTNKRPLILCVGNRLRRDDGFGPVVADELRSLEISDMDIEESWGEGTKLMQAWEGRSHVIIVDAAHSGTAEPGVFHYFNATETEIPRDFFRYTTHRFGVAEAVELARNLKALPPQVEIYAVEGEDFGNGEGLTLRVEQAVEGILKRLLPNYKPD